VNNTQILIYGKRKKLHLGLI